MNTDIITLTEILGTDSVSSSRITINDNFNKLVKAVGDIQTRIDTSKNTLYVNVIETESGEFAIKTTPNRTTRFKIDNAGNIYIGSMPLDEYIRRAISNTKFVELDIYDADDNKMEFQAYAGIENNDEGDKSKASYVVVYYHDGDTEFKVKLNVPENIKKTYPNAKVIVYDEGEQGTEPEPNVNENEQEAPLEPNVDDVYTFSFDENNISAQRTIAIVWIPNTAIQETYTFTLEKIEE